MYKKSKYSGYYKPKKMTQDSRLANQQKLRYAKVIASRGGGAPIANRGFGSMSITSNRERKFFDLAPATYGVNDVAVFTLLHVPILGADFDNRIGRKTMIKSVYVRGNLQIRNAAAAPALNTNTFNPPQLCRMIIMVDLQPNGATPLITDLLTSATVQAQLNPNNRDRFRIIKDKQYSLDLLNISNNGNVLYGFENRTTHDIKCYKKLNLETIFNQTNAGSIGDISSGALYMVWMGSNNSAVGAVANLSTRVRFDDT